MNTTTKSIQPIINKINNNKFLNQTQKQRLEILTSCLTQAPLSPKSEAEYHELCKIAHLKPIC